MNCDGKMGGTEAKEKEWVCMCEGDTETRPLVYEDTPRQR